MRALRMREVVVHPAASEAIRVHAARGYPFEICGFLAGSTSDTGRVVREAWPVTNAWETDRDLRTEMLAGVEAGVDRWEAHGEERRFLVSPRDTAASMKRAREAGLDLVGVYHTHPDHPAVPSDFDRDAAWPEWSYIIVSVRDGKVADFRSWALVEPEGRFEEEAVVEEAA